MINFIAFVICVAAGIWQIYNGNVELCLMEFALAVINLQFSIKWMKELFE